MRALLTKQRTQSCVDISAPNCYTDRIPDVGNFASASGRALTAIHHDRSAEMKMAFTSWSVGKMMEEPGPQRTPSLGYRHCSISVMFHLFKLSYSFGAFLIRCLGIQLRQGLDRFNVLVDNCFYFLEAVTGRLADRFGPRRGVRRSYQHGISLYLTSLVQAIWVGFITYGVGVGTATACGYVPMF